MRGLLVILFFLTFTTVQASTNSRNQISKSSKNTKLSWFDDPSHSRWRRDATICHITREEYEKMVETTEKDSVKSRKIRIGDFLEIYEDAGEGSIKTQQMRQLARKLILHEGATTDNANYKMLFQQKTGVDPDFNAGRTDTKGSAAVAGDDHASAGLFEHPYRDASVFGEQGTHHKSFESVRYGENRPSGLQQMENLYRPGEQHPQRTFYESVLHPGVELPSPYPEHVNRMTGDSSYVFNSDYYTKFALPDYSKMTLNNMPHMLENIPVVPRPKITLPTIFKPPIFRGGKLGK